MFDQITSIAAATGQNEPSWYMWDHPGWYMGIHWFFWIALVVVTFGIGLALIRMSARPVRATQETPAVAILDDRYARGEINRGEYLERKQDLS